MYYLVDEDAGILMQLSAEKSKAEDILTEYIDRNALGSNVESLHVIEGREVELTTREVVSLRGYLD